MPLTPIVALLQLTTILPLGRVREFAEFARRSWLYPLAGYVIGGICACSVYFIGQPLVAAAIAIGILFLLTGCNHLDSFSRSFNRNHLNRHLVTGRTRKTRMNM